VIARATLKNAPILVLDEATAFADPENESLIQKALEQLMKTKRLSSSMIEVLKFETITGVFIMSATMILQIGIGC
jgi:ATP-binding cassette subfamily B protein